MGFVLVKFDLHLEDDLRRLNSSYTNEVNLLVKTSFYSMYTIWTCYSIC